MELAEILKELARPFPVEAIQWKPGVLSQDRSRALALPYVDSREYMERLDKVCPDWQDSYEVTVLPDRILVICRLTVGGITRTGDGEALLADARGEVDENALTSASAQAFKRACAKFGLGRHLYSIPKVWVEYNNGFTQEALEILRNAVTGETPDTPDAKESHGQNSQNGAASRSEDIVVKFGKHSGKTLRQIAEEDPEYLRWLAANWEWQQGRHAAAILVKKMEIRRAQRGNPS